MEKSETIAALATALAAAQGELSNAVKDAKNPNFRSTYATLAAVRDTVFPVLSRHGLSVVQMPGQDEARVTLTTLLLHKSGEWISSVCSAVPGKADAQGLGSVVTYLRRYSLAAITGIAQEDDDGQAAAAPPQSAACTALLARIGSAETAEALDAVASDIQAAKLVAFETSALRAAYKARKAAL